MKLAAAIQRPTSEISRRCLCTRDTLCPRQSVYHVTPRMRCLNGADDLKLISRQTAPVCSQARPHLDAFRRITFMVECQF